MEAGAEGEVPGGHRGQAEEELQLRPQAEPRPGGEGGQVHPQVQAQGGRGHLLQGRHASDA